MSTKNIHFRENAFHGDNNFHFSLYSINNTDNRKILVHRHWHEEIEIVYVQDGKMSVEVSGEKLILKTGEILFIPPEHIHEFKKINTYSCKFYSIVFSLSLLVSSHSTIIYNKYLRTIKKAPNFYLFQQHHLNNEQVVKITEDIINLYRTQPYGYELLVNSYLFSFIFLVLQQGIVTPDAINSLSPSTNMKIKKIIKYLEDNYSNKITLDDMATLVCTSREYFSRFFKKYFQMNFSEYLTTYRVSKATYLLITTNWKILDIAIDSGFNDASYFTSIFTKYMKMTPTQYRKKHSKII